MVKQALGARHLASKPIQVGFAVHALHDQACRERVEPLNLLPGVAQLYERRDGPGDHSRQGGAGPRGCSARPGTAEQSAS